VTTNTRLRHARALFGLTTDQPDPRPSLTPAAATLDRALTRGQIALITGPSGAGKTTILRAVADLARTRGEPTIEVGLADHPPDIPMIDLFRRSVPRTLALLAKAGLADATLYGRGSAELSGGQRFRLSLALAMAHAESHPRAGPCTTLLADEFASCLDPTTAACIARMLHRWTRASRNVRTICASPHDAILEPLAPDVVIYQPLGSPAAIRSRDDQRTGAQR